MWAQWGVAGLIKEGGGGGAHTKDIIIWQIVMSTSMLVFTENDTFQMSSEYRGNDDDQSYN